MATQADKEAKARLQSQKLRQKDEKKSIKAARKIVGKESNYLDAFYRARKVQDNIMGLPKVLWPFVLIVGYLWAHNTWEKESRERDLREAREFLRQSSSKRI